MIRNSKRLKTQPRKRGKKQNDIEMEEKGAFKGQKTTNRSNDVSWYSRSPELLQAAANIGFSYTAGTPDGNNIINPGVMVLPFFTSIGGFFASPINQASNSIYTYVVHANSRNVSYSSSDMMALLLAGKEVFVGIANLIRVYGLMLKTNQENRYTPQALVTGCGIAFGSAKSNYNKMLYDINNLIAQSRQIWLPNVMPVVTRQFWMASNVYQDSESVKGQYYMYVPGTLRYFDETSYSSGIRLIPDPDWDPYTGMTWDTAVGVVQNMIDKLVNSESRGVIFGDILKAYGEENIFKVEYIDSNYEVTPVYDQEVLSQMENSTSIGRYGTFAQCASIIAVNNSSNLISEIQGTLDTAVSTARPTYNFPTDGILNFHFKGQPSPEQVMVATRLMAVGNSTTVMNNSGTQNFVTGTMPRICGTEWIVQPYIITNSIDDDGTYTIGKDGFPRLLTAATVSSDVDTAITRLAKFTNFDWAPLCMYGSYTGNTATALGTFTPTRYIGDIDNYIVLPQSVIYRMHQAALLSEFGVPVLL